MTKTRLKKKQAALDRAAPSYPPGGAMMYVSPQQLQSIYGQTFYGTTLKNLPVGQTSLFSPGAPLPTQQGVNPNGLPVQFRFPIAYNSFPVDRTLGSPDIPSFEQLKRLAIMDYGIGLCERYWLDMVPRMTLKISLTKEAVAGGAEEKNYQDELTYFKNFFSRPDPGNGLDIHSWLRSALINQSRYDELYLYKNRTRGGKLLGLEVIDGSQMKPLLDDWGRLPAPPHYAYQQYPWGIPGWQYRQDQMTHYRESPASDTPYGFSRIERIILITNLALRKQKMDLAHFTEGNIPAGILTPPEGSSWTPDQLDSYEQSWNALLAGNLQQLARIKVVQPGFSYTPFVQPSLDAVIDRFWLNIRTAAYGMTLADLGFTETVNKSSGDSQENVTYRRTIGPIAMIYAMMLTDCMQHDFEPALHGDLFMAEFGGYEESEDAAAKATELTMYTNAGILGLTNAAKLAKLPEDPDAPHIGRVFMTANGPIFLDDMASDQMREAAAKAKMAGLELAANPAQPDGNTVADGGNTDESEDTGDDEEEAPQTAKKAPVPGKATAGNVAAKTPPSSGAASANKGNTAAQPATKKDSTQQRVLMERSDGSSDGAPVAPSQHTGIMVAFCLNAETAQQLALPGGEPWQHLHITLAYLGNTDVAASPGKLHPAETPEVLGSVLQAFTSAAQPLQGSVGGLARFTPSASSDGLAPVIALVNAPGLQDWRRRLVNVLDAAGYEIARDFDFTPHITLAYIDAEAPMPVDTLEPLPLSLDTLILAIGDEVTYFPIGGPDEPRTPQDTAGEARSVGDPGRGNTEAPAARASAGVAQPGATGDNRKEAAIDYRRWRSRAVEDAKNGRAQRGFTSSFIPQPIHDYLSQLLARCATSEQVRTVFSRAQAQESELVGGQPRLEYNAKLGIWEAADTEEQLEAMKKQGTQYLQWNTGSSASGVCPVCAPNDGKVVKVGEQFPSGHRLPQCHNHCQCNVNQFKEKPVK